MDFIYLDGFERQWKQLKLDDADRKALRVAIAIAGGKSPVIRGTGGLRKIRYSPLASQRGKSSGVRVCYAFFPAYGIALLVSVYAKGRKDDLTAGERKAIRRELIEFERELERGPIQ